mgnify:CR=1 FL=1
MTTSQNTVTRATESILDRLTSKYLQYEKDTENRIFIEKLSQDGNVRLLQLLIGSRLVFGTAGIRGRMGPGFGQMNDLVVIQTSQGLASYLLELDAESVRNQGVIIGHDARHNSSRFARLAALAFIQKGIPVFLDHYTPTPLIAFGVTHLGCFAGIQITASHNPKSDNGYKVYFANGAQILAPHDKRIQEHIEMNDNQEPWPLAWRHELLEATSNDNHELPTNLKSLLKIGQQSLRDDYFGYIRSLVCDRYSCNRSSSTRITYTSMHGVGHEFLTRALEISGFDKCFPVDSQKEPDPEFPTVAFPNPEEAGALDLAFETANETSSNLILAIDPDADRCAAALYDPKMDRKRIFTGNEIGTLLGWWAWYRYATGKESSASIEPADCFMISTAVSSKFLQSMASVEGFSFVETLTGFKYMGNLAHKLISENKMVLFAYEEAIGYMVNPTILDKDGISAAVELAQCAAHVESTYNRTLEQQLDILYLKYGFHFSLNSYYVSSDPTTTKSIFTNLQSDYPSEFRSGDQSFRVERVRDLNNGFDSGEIDNRAKLPCSSSSYMVTFFIEGNITITFRTSGTEPKIKYYSEIVAKLPSSSGQPTGEGGKDEELQRAAQESARKRLQLVVEIAVKRCLDPERHSLAAAQ